MNKKNLIIIGCIVGLVFSIGAISLIGRNSSKMKSKSLKTVMGTVTKYNGSTVTIQDADSIIYTFNVETSGVTVGDKITIECSGVLNKNSDNQDCDVLSYRVSRDSDDQESITNVSFLESDLFGNFYKLAKQKLEKMTLDEKIGQLLLVRYPDSNQVETLKKYKFGGYIFFAKDFKDKTEEEVKTMMRNLQNASSIPILTAVDEEGGSVVRISSNPSLVSEKFKSPSELYKAGGFTAIKDDTINKSKVLNSLGINLNLAPVVDVSTNSSDHMYERTLKENTELTSTYAKTVIEASKNTGVSYTLKHFPGHGNNQDTHVGPVTDNRSYDDILKNDIPPFTAGINAKAEAVMVSHNIVTNIDNANPASLSAGVHNLLRNELKFTGVIMTDDIAMGALNNIDNATVKAIQAGNDLIITTDYAESFTSLKNAVENNTLTEEQINNHALRILAWKYYKLLMLNNQK